MFSIKLDDVKLYPKEIRGVTKSTLFIELLNVNKRTKKLTLGFDENSLPNKEYLVRMLYYL